MRLRAVVVRVAVIANSTLERCTEMTSDGSSDGGGSQEAFRARAPLSAVDACYESVRIDRKWGRA
jgi:hypothetical protein